METPRRLAPKIDTLRALYAKSSNQCAYPGCDHPLIDENNESVGQVCHIEDALPGGRFNENMTNEQRRSYDNLILLCYRHHIRTNDIKEFPPDKLKKIKLEHEAKASDIFEVREETLLQIFNELSSIKDDTSQIRSDSTEILDEVKSHSQQLDEIKSIVLKSKDQSERVSSEFAKEIDTAVKLIDTNNQRPALNILTEVKENSWEKLNNLEKYRVLANMGICYLDLNNPKEASSNFIECIKYNPNDEKALSYAAIGYVLSNQDETAKETIEKVISINPENTNAQVAKIILNYNDRSFTEIYTTIPEKLLSTQEIQYALGGFAYHKKDLKTSIEWYQKAVDTATKHKADFQATLASTILESITNPIQYITGQIDSETRNRIRYSIELLSEAWEKVKESDLRSSRVWILTNRAVAKKFIGDFDGAFDDSIKAANIAENDCHTLKNLMIISFELGRLDKSLETLDKIETICPASSDPGFNRNLFRANILIKKEEYKKSIDLLKSIIDKPETQGNILEAKGTLIHAYLANGDFKEAKDLSNEIVEENPDKLSVYIDAAKVYESLNEDDQAVIYLRNAFEKVSQESDPIDIRDLAFQFYEKGEFEETIDLLERITDTQLYSELSRVLIRAYYNIGETAKALELCSGLSKKYGPEAFTTEIVSAVYESIDNFPEAIKTCEDYLAIYPDDQRIKARLAILYSRIKDVKRLKHLLDGLDVLGTLPTNVVFNIAYLNISVGELRRGLDLAYSERRRSYNIGETHLHYISLVFKTNEISDFTEGVDVVTVNTAVTLKDEFDKTQTYCIVDEITLPTKEELLITDELGKLLIGKKVGDTISIERQIGSPQKFTIVSILSKYVHALHESIGLLDNKFVNVEGFRVIQGGKTGDPKEDFKPLFDVLDKAEKQEQKLHDFYSKKKLPIGTLAQLRKQNPIKAWSSVVGNLEYGIHSIGPNQNEIQSAYKLLESGRGIVIELVSLLTLGITYNLNLLKPFPNKIAIARSTIDCIDELLKEYNNIGSDGFLTLGKIEGKYVKEHITSEEIRNRREQFEGLISWIDENCEVLPCTEALSMNAAKKEEFDSLLGKPFIDSILIAKENDYIILAEEEPLRSFAKSEFQVIGCPVYTILSYCLNTGNIDVATFNTEVSKLISLNHMFLPVNSGILLKCAEIAEYKNAFPFDLATKTLEGRISSEDSSIQLAVYFMFELSESSLLPNIRLNLILPVLYALFSERNVFTVFKKLTVLIEHKFRFLPLQKDELHSIINDFVKTKLFI